MARPGRPKTIEGEQLRRFAKARGFSERAARTHRAAKSAAWLDFLRGDGDCCDVGTCDNLAGGAGSASATPETVELQQRRAMTAAAWRQWRENAAAYDAAQRQRCGADTLRKWEGAVSRAQARYEASLAAEGRLKVQAGLLIPFEKVQALQHELAPLAQLVHGLKDMIARGLPEGETRSLFFEAFRNAESAWNLELARINEKIAEVLPCF